MKASPSSNTNIVVAVGQAQEALPSEDEQSVDSFEPLYTKAKPLNRRWNGLLSDYLNVHRHYPNFNWFFAGQTLDELGNFFYLIATTLALLQRVDGKVGKWAYFELVQAPAQIVVTLIGGTIADRFDRKGYFVLLQIIKILIIPINIYVLINGNMATNLLMKVVEAVVNAALPNGLMLPLLVPDSHDLTFAKTTIAWTASIFGLLEPLTGKLTGKMGLIPSAIIYGACSTLAVFCYTFGIRGDFRPTRASKLPERIDNKPNRAKRTFLPFQELAVYLFACGFGALTFMNGTASQASGSLSLPLTDLSLVRTASGTIDQSATGLRLGTNKALAHAGTLVGPLLFNTFTDGTKPKSLQRAAVLGFAIMLMATALLVPASLWDSYALAATSDFFRVFGRNVVNHYSILALLVLSDKELFGRMLGFHEAMSWLLSNAVIAVVSKLMNNGASNLVAAWISVGLGTFWFLVWGSHYWLGKGAADPRFNQVTNTTNSKIVLETEPDVEQNDDPCPIQ